MISLFRESSTLLEILGFYERNCRHLCFDQDIYYLLSYNMLLVLLGEFSVYFGI